MRIVLASHGHRLGGAENMLLLLAKLLSQRGYEVHAIVPEDGSFADEARSAGANVKMLEMDWAIGLKARTNTRFLKQWHSRVTAIAAFLRGVSPAVVVSNTCTVLDTALASILVGLPHIQYQHELLSRSPELAPAGSIQDYYNLVLAASDRVVVCGECVKEEMQRHSRGGEISVIPEAIDARQFLGVPPRTTSDARILFLGRISERKGVHDIVRCAPKIIGRFPNLRIQLAGVCDERDPYVKKLFRTMAQLGVRSHFEFLGFRKDKLALLEAADVVLMPSLCDPFPLAVIEAMASGRPVVATRSGGTEEMLIEGRTGFLVAPGDAEGMADAVIRMLEDSALAHRMGEAGRQRALEQYDMRLFGNRWESVLQSSSSGFVRKDPGRLVEGLLAYVSSASTAQATEEARCGCRGFLRSVLPRFRKLAIRLSGHLPKHMTCVT